MNCAPVIIPTLNRYDHFVKCVESLKRNAHASETELIVGLDFPPAAKYEEGYRRIDEYLSSLTGFKAVTVLRRAENMGAIANIKDLVAYAFERNDRLIFSEDDNVFAPNFLDYVNKGLDLYENDKNIASISGFSYPVAMPESGSTVVKMQRYFSDWGFGVWKDRYLRIKTTLDNAWVRSMLRDRRMRRTLRSKSRKNYVYSVRLIKRHDIRPMDYTNSIFQTVHDRYTIMPKVTLVKNEGFDNTGVHCKTKDPQNAILKELLAGQVLDTRDHFPDFILDESETDLVNKLVDESPVGNYSKKAFQLAQIKVLLLRMGLIDLLYAIKEKRKQP
jgi:hypothetical protein